MAAELNMKLIRNASVKIYRSILLFFLDIVLQGLSCDWQKEMIDKFIAEQGLDATIWDYQTKDLLNEIERRNTL